MPLQKILAMAGNQKNCKAEPAAIAPKRNHLCHSGTDSGIAEVRCFQSKTAP